MTDDLNEMAPGDDVPADVPNAAPEPCPDCHGSGEKDGGECPTCVGTGEVIKAVGGG